MLRFYCYIILFCSFHSEKTLYRLKEVNIKPTGLSVSLFSFNYQKPSDWIENLLGQSSISWQLPGKIYTPPDMSSLTTAFLDEHSNVVLRYLNISADWLRSDCSLEMLAYLPTKDSPFNRKYLSKYIPVGTADTVFLNKTWNCIYRGKVAFGWSHHITAAFLYCQPTSAYQKNCNNKFRSLLADNPKSSDVSVSFHLTGKKNYTTKFTVIQQSTSEQESGTTTPVDSAELTNQQKISPIAGLAVCTVVTYANIDPKSDAINQAILFEWIRYYFNLGIKVIVYERDKHNSDHIFYSIYVKRQNLTEWEINNIKQNILYFNYTIHDFYHIQKDKGDETGNSDFDKTFTLTQCRAVAHAEYGIDRVVVADFDEFLYCPSAASASQAKLSYSDRMAFVVAQAAHIQKYLIEDNLSREVNQVSLMQIAVPHKLDKEKKNNGVEGSGTLDCLYSRVISDHNTSNIAAMPLPSTSIFDCFGDYGGTGHTKKSLHLDYSCPLTHYHHACGDFHTPELIGYECLCKPVDVDPSQCGFAHLALRHTSFVVYQSPITINSADSSLWVIANNNPQFVYKDHQT